MTWCYGPRPLPGCRRRERTSLEVSLPYKCFLKHMRIHVHTHRDPCFLMEPYPHSCSLPPSGPFPSCLPCLHLPPGPGKVSFLSCSGSLGGTSGWPEFSPADLEAAEGEDGIGVIETIVLAGLGVMGCEPWQLSLLCFI